MMPTYWTPGQWYYDHDGLPIDLMTWADLTGRESKFVKTNSVTLPDNSTAVLTTVYLGFVDNSIAEARLFGTALVYDDEKRIAQLDVWDTKQDAINGHARHHAAILLGHHCYRCQMNESHVWM